MTEPLKVGTKAPDFTLAKAGGETYSLAEARKAGPVVVAFFPFAFSGTCTSEFCTFTDRLADFSDKGTSVVGVSVDSTFAQEAWAAQKNITIPLASDFNKETAAAFGVLYENFKGFGRTAKRSIFLLDAEGIVRYVWVTEDAGVEPDYDELRKAVEKLGK